MIDCFACLDLRSSPCRPCVLPSLSPAHSTPLATTSYRSTIPLYSDERGVTRIYTTTAGLSFLSFFPFPFLFPPQQIISASPACNAPPSTKQHLSAATNLARADRASLLGCLRPSPGLTLHRTNEGACFCGVSLCRATSSFLGRALPAATGAACSCSSCCTTSTIRPPFLSSSSPFHL